VDYLASELEQERGVKPVLVVSNPNTPGIGQVTGYAVVLDERVDVGMFHFR
jgi:hypothetical protein